MMRLKTVIFWILLLSITGLLTGCQTSPKILDSNETPGLSQLPAGMTEAEAATLSSLKQISPYPLYTMQYQASYERETLPELILTPLNSPVPDWGCSLFAAMGDPDQMVYGRNFDWEFSPGLLLFTDPPHGYASVSMVDIAYLGYGGERAYGLTALPLDEQAGLLDAPYLPFDGMNEAGLAVGMAAVPAGRMEFDPAKKTLGSLLVIRAILDQAATVEEAVAILNSFNIDMGEGPPLHYLIADSSGQSVLVEFSWEEVKTLFNSDPWQLATNFLVSETGGEPGKQCWRYAVISEELADTGGKLTISQGMDLLEEVAQANTQWSVVYEFSTGEVNVAMGRQFWEVHTFLLDNFND